MSEYKICYNTHNALRRYMALLFSLAILADRMCLAPGPVRQLVLFILRPGESRARAYVSQIAVDFGVWPDLPGADGFGGAYSPEAAARLSLCFCALGELLEDMMWLDLENAAAAQHPRWARLTCLPERMETFCPQRKAFAARIEVAPHLSGVPPPRQTLPNVTSATNFPAASCPRPAMSGRSGERGRNP